MARIKVRADFSKILGENKFGYYGDKRRKQGDVFFINSEKEFSKKWMVKVDGNEKQGPVKSRPLTGDPRMRLPVVDPEEQSGQDSSPSQNDAGADGEAAGQDTPPTGNQNVI